MKILTSKLYNTLLSTVIPFKTYKMSFMKYLMEYIVPSFHPVGNVSELTSLPDNVC